MTNPPTTWTLTDPEIELGGYLAETRIAHAQNKNLIDRNHGGHPIDRRVIHYRGAWAEVAAARYLDVPIPQDQQRRFHKRPDLDPNIEIRWSKRGILSVYDADRADQVFVLVTGEPPTLTLVGWIGGDELDWTWRADGRWIVPTDALHPMPELRDKIKNR